MCAKPCLLSTHNYFYMYLCIFIYVSSIHTRRCTHTRTHMHTCTHKHTSTHTRAHDTHMHSHTHSHVGIDVSNSDVPAGGSFQPPPHPRVASVALAGTWPPTCHPRNMMATWKSLPWAPIHSWLSSRLFCFVSMTRLTLTCPL